MKSEGFFASASSFKADYIAHRKARTQRDYRRMIETHFLPTLKPKRMDAITLSAISHPLVVTPSEQAHALAPICVPKSELNDGKSISDRN